jgi:hypothetical protein
MRYLIGLAITALVGVGGWLLFGDEILDRIDESNAVSGGGGPPEKRIVSANRFTPVAAKLRRAAGPEARGVSVTVRPQSVELVAVSGGRASGYRWRDRREGIERFAVGGAGEAGQVDGNPWPLRRLDPRAPERITRAVSEAEGGDFQLSIGDLQRAGSGRLVWVMRGRIGERGIAYSARPDGGGVKPYDPSSPDLSKGAALSECIKRAGADPAKVQRCADRFAR